MIRYSNMKTRKDHNPYGGPFGRPNQVEKAAVTSQERPPLFCLGSSGNCRPFAPARRRISHVIIFNETAGPFCLCSEETKVAMGARLK